MLSLSPIIAFSTEFPDLLSPPQRRDVLPRRSETVGRSGENFWRFSGRDRRRSNHDRGRGRGQGEEEEKTLMGAWPKLGGKKARWKNCLLCCRGIFELYCRTMLCTFASVLTLLGQRTCGHTDWFCCRLYTGFGEYDRSTNEPTDCLFSASRERLFLEFFSWILCSEVMKLVFQTGR